MPLNPLKIHLFHYILSKTHEIVPERKIVTQLRNKHYVDRILLYITYTHEKGAMKVARKNPLILR
jgi:hypothetical protein